MCRLLFVLWATTILPSAATAQCELQKLTQSDAELNDFFGNATALQGDVALIAAPSDDNDNGFTAGSVYVFRFDGSDWVEEQKLTASDGSSYDRFGTGVAVEGDLAVAGAPRDDDNGSSSGSAYLFRFDGSTWVEEQKITASDGAPGDELGIAVALSESVVLVGARGDDESSGSAYAYRFDGSTWVEEQKLTAADGVGGDELGIDVALSGTGNVALVGAWGDDGSAGSAYVFRFDGSTWMEEQKLTASDGAGEDEFGLDVALSGNGTVALIGAQGDDDVTGSAYVYRFDGSTWVEEQKLTASDAAVFDYFGNAVAVMGDVALVGALADDDNGNNSGSVYLFRFDGREWVEDRKLKANDGSSVDNFGSSVSLTENLAVIGAHRDSPNGIQSGSAYVFDLTGELCGPEYVLHDGSVSFVAEFGTAVAVGEDVAAVGAPDQSIPGVIQAGTVRVFRREDEVWTVSAAVLAPDADDYDHFGATVAIGGDVLAVGAPDEGNSDRGAVYVFRRSGSDDWVHEQKLLADDGDTGDHFGSAIAVQGNRIAIGSPRRDDPANGFNAGAVYLFEYLGGGWAQVQLIVASDGEPGDRFGTSAALGNSRLIVGAPRHATVCPAFPWCHSGAVYVLEKEGSSFEEPGQAHGQ